MSTWAIEAVDIQKAYRTGNVVTPVLRGISLQVERGSCVFLVGPSGSGKTTLLSIFGCVLSADAGQLRLFGENATAFNARLKARFRRERVGILFQRFHLFRGLRAWENVGVALRLLGHPAAYAKAESHALLERVGLAAQASSQVTRLSVGQCQRVALARALAGEPDLILADEPTASLDAQSGLAAMQMLRRLCKEQGKTVVVVTHDSRIFPLADRILELEDGRLKDESPLREAAQKTQAAPRAAEIYQE